MMTAIHWHAPAQSNPTLTLNWHKQQWLEVPGCVENKEVATVQNILRLGVENAELEVAVA